jgi:hypothetical protein
MTTKKRQRCAAASVSDQSLGRAASASGWERLMDARLPLWSVTLLVLVGLAGALMLADKVRKAVVENRPHSVALELATIPLTLRRLLRGERPDAPFRPYADAKDDLPLPGGFWRNPAQPFTDPGYELLTAFDEAAGRPVIRLIRLRDGRVIHEYRPDIDGINARSRFRSALIDLQRDRGVDRNLMMHPLLMPDGGLVIHDSSPLARVDACGHVMWVVDGIFHHSIERSADGMIWAAYRYPVSPMLGVAPSFDDEAIARISPDGRLLGLDRIADILDRNGLGELWRSRPYVDDPFHLNDVQPVPGTGRYWRLGDLFLSLRNLSMIALYRPSTGRILWSRIGPWAMQHDVSVVNDHSVSAFDNHWRFAAPEGEIDRTNRLPVYDFATDQTRYPFAHATLLNHIATRAQGRATPMPNGDMVVEETERGRLLRFAPDGTVRWRYISADSRRRRFQLRWSRYLDPVNDGPSIQNAVNARCS